MECLFCARLVFVVRLRLGDGLAISVLRTAVDYLHRPLSTFTAVVAREMARDVPGSEFCYLAFGVGVDGMDLVSRHLNRRWIAWNGL